MSSFSTQLCIPLWHLARNSPQCRSTTPRPQAPAAWPGGPQFTYVSPDSSTTEAPASWLNNPGTPHTLQHTVALCFMFSPKMQHMLLIWFIQIAKPVGRSKAFPALRKHAFYMAVKNKQMLDWCTSGCCVCWCVGAAPLYLLPAGCPAAG